MKKYTKKVQAALITISLSFSILLSNSITVFAASNNGADGNIVQTQNLSVSPNKVSSDVVQIAKDESKKIESHVKTVKKDGNNKVITLDSSNTRLKNLKIGDIFMMDSTKDNPFGLVGKVVSNTTTDDGKNVLEITNPKIDELFSELKFDVNKYLKKADLISSNFPSGTAINFIPNDNQGEDIKISLPNLNFSYKGIKINNAPTILLKNPSIATNLDLKNLSGIKNFEAKLSTTIECEDKLSLKGGGEIHGNDLVKLTNMNNILGSNSNSIGIDNIASLSGVDMNDKILLGSLTYTVGSNIPVIRPGGSVVDIPLGATLFIYMTLDGKVEAEADIDMKQSCYIEKGINLKGVTVDKVIPDNTKTGVTIDGTVSGDLKVGVGAGLGIVVIGIIPADVTIAIVGDINGTAKGQIDVINKTCTGSVNLNGSIKLLSEGNFKLQLQFLKLPPIKIDKAIPFLDKTLYDWKYATSFASQIETNKSPAV